MQARAKEFIRSLLEHKLAMCRHRNAEKWYPVRLSDRRYTVVLKSRIHKLKFNTVNIPIVAAVIHDKILVEPVVALAAAVHGVKIRIIECTFSW